MNETPKQNEEQAAGAASDCNELLGVLACPFCEGSGDMISDSGRWLSICPRCLGKKFVPPDRAWRGISSLRIDFPVETLDAFGIIERHSKSIAHTYGRFAKESMTIERQGWTHWRHVTPNAISSAKNAE